MAEKWDVTEAFRRVGARQSGPRATRFDSYITTLIATMLLFDDEDPTKASDD